MKTLEDKNKKIIKLLDSVIMPSPRADDIWSIGGFRATVIDFRGNNLIVENQDSDCF